LFQVIDFPIHSKFAQMLPVASLAPKRGNSAARALHLLHLGVASLRGTAILPPTINDLAAAPVFFLLYL
jgi:hypothetical protein